MNPFGKGWWRVRWLVWTVLATSLTLLGLLVYLAEVYEKIPPTLIQWETDSQDLRSRIGRHTPPNPDLVLVALDPQTMFINETVLAKDLEQSPTLQLLTEDWPISRAVYAELLDRLVAAGAKLVILDFIFPREARGDAELREAIDRHADKVILATNISNVGAAQGGSAVFSLPTPSILTPDEEGFQDIGDGRLGLVTVWPDGDKVVRRWKYSLSLNQIGGQSEFSDFHEGDQLLFTLAGQALNKMGLADRIPQPTGHAFRFRFTGEPFDPTRGRGHFPVYPLYEIFVPKLWEANLKNGEVFKDKVVMVGPWGNFFKDELLTPYQLFPGPELHLNALNAAIHGEFLTETTPLQDLVIIAAMGLIAGLLVFMPRPEQRVWVTLLLTAAFLFVTQWLYNHHGLFVLTILPLVTLNSITFLGFTYEFILERVERARTRATFERYMSKNVVRELLDRKEEYELLLGGSRKPVTVLFSDVRGFTTMTESADSAKLVEQLNQYLTSMVGCVFKTEGTLDKFIGDAVMAVWGNTPGGDPHSDAKKGIICALDMLDALRTLNETWEAQGMKPFQIGIGLNHGDVICGNMGAPERMEFTVIGDAVNLASRIESLTKEYGLELLIGESLATIVRDDFHLQPIDLVQVKGKTKPVEILTVHGLKTTPLPPDLARYLEHFNRGIAEFRRREFSAALKSFTEAETHRPGDKTARDYIDQCHACIATPPSPDWDGVRIMTKK